MNKAMKNFAYNPVQLDIPRSKMTMKHSHKTTFNTGQLIPIYWREVIPGSTVKMEMAEVTRMQTPIFPIMDNAFIDTMFFFVPNRILWEHWEEFMGENKTGFWEQQTPYEVPQISFNSNNQMITTGAPPWIKGQNYYPYAVQTGSLADYLGIPVVDANTATPTWRGEFKVNALPFRAYYQIYNDWWRDENLMYPMEYDKGDATITAAMGSSDPEDTAPLVPPKIVAKFHDYFTSALPQPQKHDDVLLPLGVSAPIIGTAEVGTDTSNLKSSLVGQPLYFKAGGSNVNYNSRMYDVEDSTNYTGAGYNIGLAADLSAATGSTINALRQAFAVQRFYEKQARGGRAKACASSIKKSRKKTGRLNLKKAC